MGRRKWVKRGGIDHPLSVPKAIAKSPAVGGKRGSVRTVTGPPFPILPLFASLGRQLIQTARRPTNISRNFRHQPDIFFLFFDNLLSCFSSSHSTSLHRDPIIRYCVSSSIADRTHHPPIHI